MTKEQAELKLIEAGAVKEKAQDRHGDTKTGWWLDGVFLGRDAKTAWEGLSS